MSRCLGFPPQTLAFRARCWIGAKRTRCWSWHCFRNERRTRGQRMDWEGRARSTISCKDTGNVMVQPDAFGVGKEPKSSRFEYDCPMTVWKSHGGCRFCGNAALRTSSVSCASVKLSDRCPTHWGWPVQYRKNGGEARPVISATNLATLPRWIECGKFGALIA